MTFKKWMHLFGTTLLIGAAAALAAGIVLQLTDQNLQMPGVSGLSFNLFEMLLAGLMFSVLSQMGFFAYLMLNYIAISIVRQKYWWNLIQVFLIIVVMFDTAYLRYINFEEKVLWSYMVLPLLLLAAGWGVSYWKVRMTNASAWIPTLFLMSAITAIESVPALKVNNPASTFFMVIPLFACNSWQILQLHKLVAAKKS